jgi:hypothetical protein
MRNSSAFAATFGPTGLEENLSHASICSSIAPATSGEKLQVARPMLSRSTPAPSNISTYHIQILPKTILLGKELSEKKRKARYKPPGCILADLTLAGEAA